MVHEIAPESFIAVGNERSQVLEHDNGSVTGVTIAESVHEEDDVLSIKNDATQELVSMRAELEELRQLTERNEIRIKTKEKLMILAFLLSLACSGVVAVWLHLQDLGHRNEVVDLRNEVVDLRNDVVSLSNEVVGLRQELELQHFSPLEGMSKAIVGGKDVAAKVFEWYVGIPTETEEKSL